jgi:required for meiotic nuclear division protein 1
MVNAPSQRINIQAYQVAQGFNIKKLRSDFTAQLHSGNNSELFYHFEETARYLYIFDYGVIVFGNYDDLARSEFLRFVKPYSDTELGQDLFENYAIQIDANSKKSLVQNDVALVTEATPSVVKIVMLNTGQSAALEYYENLTNEMLESNKQYTQQLESKGKIQIPKVALLKYIGRVLNVKNSIVDNLYILDDPNMVWDDPELDALNRNLKANFDINPRFRDLDYRLQIVEDNLKLFTDLIQNRDSTRLEWVVIILILVEVLNIFVGFGRHG